MKEEIVIVPVKEEPNHHELYDDPNIRVYLARLAPGQSTKTHSHNQDTLYVAVHGGEIETFNHPLDEGCANKLLKSYPMKYKLQLLLAKLRKKPMTLKDGFSFFMASGTKKVIHRAVASKNNKQDMLLLGIEIKKVIR